MNNHLRCDSKCNSYRNLHCRKNRKNYALISFLLGLGLSLTVIVPVMIYDKGYFLYYGDFNVQEIPFYKLAHDSILSGNIKWNHLTDLGSNFIGSYSFYILGSPFFYLTLLLPNELVAYSIGPILALKIGCASFTAYIFLRRYVSDKRYAVLGGLLYAFSGFSIYNIFFFHFHEPMIVFPLLLAAIDEYINTKRKGVVALTIAASAIINYYFFFGQAVFCLIYYIVKAVSKSFKFRFKDLLILAFEAIVGVLICAFLMLPSLAAIVGNSRVSEIISGYDALVYSNSQKYMQIFSSIFFLPDIPAIPNMAPSAGGKWASVSLYLPMVSTVFVFAFLSKAKKTAIKRIIIILTIMAFVPVLNSVFQALNSIYYARWFYMFTLMLVLATIIEMESASLREIKTGFVYTAVITTAIAIAIGFMPYKSFESDDVTLYKIGLEKNQIRFWVYIAISLIGIGLVFTFYMMFYKKRKLLFRIISITLCVYLAGSMGYIVTMGKYSTDHSDKFVIDNALNYGKEVNIRDIKDVRSDFYKSMDNIGMYWQIPNIQAFHSIVPHSLMDFYNEVGVERNVASRPDVKYYGLRALLSVKYLFDETDDEDYFVENKKTKMPEYIYMDSKNGYDIYENKCYVPIGFSYDKYICEEEFDNLSTDVKHLALLKSMVLSQDQMKKYEEITGYKDGMYLSLNEEYNKDKPQNLAHPIYKNFKSITRDFKYSQSEYTNDCENLKINSCKNFEYTNSGFTATFDNFTDQDKLVFFSVPYDEGFTAFVNGKKVDIEKVNIGFMAVKVDKNSSSDIEFVYKTPMLKTGIIISLVGVSIFAVYIIAAKGFKANKKFKRKYKIKNS